MKMNEDVFKRMDELLIDYPEEVLTWIRRGWPGCEGIPEPETCDDGEVRQ